MFLKKMFKQQLDKTMEACIDDMVVKSKKVEGMLNSEERICVFSIVSKHYRGTMIVLVTVIPSLKIYKSMVY